MSRMPEEDVDADAKKTTVFITDNYKVEIDAFNHTLFKYVAGGEVIAYGKSKGKISEPRWNGLGYFPNMQQCIRKIINTEVVDKQTVLTLKEYLELVKQLETEFTN